MLLEQIIKDLEDATRKQDPLVLKTIRFILSEIRYEEIEKQRKLTDEEIVISLTREVKKRNDAIELMKRGNRLELVEEENKKIEVIKKYLPKQMETAELEKIVKETIASMPNPQMGAVIGAVLGKVKGRADGKIVSEIVKKLLNQ